MARTPLAKRVRSESHLQHAANSSGETNVKTNKKRVVALWLTSLAACLVLTACEKKNEAPKITPAEKKSVEKAAVAKALSDKAVTDKIAADKAAADKTAAENAAAAKAAADKAAADEKAHAAALPADLVVMKSELAQALSQIDMTIAKLEVLSVATDIKQPS